MVISSSEIEDTLCLVGKQSIEICIAWVCVCVCVCVWVRVSLRAIMHVREHKPSKKRGGKKRERGRGDRRGSCFLAPLWCNRVRATWGRSMIFCLDSTYLERELATLWLDSGGRIQVKERVRERESVCVCMFYTGFCCAHKAVIRGPFHSSYCALER